MGGEDYSIGYVVSVVLLEVCIDSEAGLRAAVDGKAGRLEVCSRLDLDGLTPSAELLAAALATRVPCVAMIRPHAGEHVYDADELERMAQAVSRAKEIGANGFAIGVLDRGGEVDRDAVRALVERASPLPITFHRAFDAAHDRSAALDALIALGVKRVLTSGGARTALEGKAVLRELVRRARGRITIIAAGGVRAQNAAEIVAASGVTEIHSSTVFTPPGGKG
jgi:copper homeostasis protein